MYHLFNKLCLGALLCGSALSSTAQTAAGGESLRYPTDQTATLFRNPPRDYYPETWFHFIGGNVSKEGVTADLEAIRDAGISGIQFFHGKGKGTWPGVTEKVETLSEKWDDMVMWVAEECQRLGLTFTMQNCPGWSYAGGPWIEPSNAMRNLVWSRTDVDGGKKQSVTLPVPQPSSEKWRDYKDLFVIAFPTPEGDTGAPLMPSAVLSNSKAVDWTAALKEDKAVKLKPSGNTPWTVSVAFDKPETIRTVCFPPVRSYSRSWCYEPGVTVDLFAMVDGKEERIAHLDMPAANWQDDQPITLACKEVETQRLRVEIANKHEMNLEYIRFYSAARQQNWESEAAWTLRRIVREDYPEQSAQTKLLPKEVRLITTAMDATGTLQLKLPRGKWTVLRIGHVNTGMKNAPAPPEATGWECTKLNPSGARANFNGYIGRLLSDNPSLRNGMMDGILIDSWECKTQTWTAGLDSIFHSKWGYELLPMMPALFGYVVESPETTAKFLRDWRVTLNDLLVKNFFGEMGDIAKANGLKISFETACGDVFPGDILEYYKYSDIPMTEFWAIKEGVTAGGLNAGNADFKPIRPTVSAARMYGKKRIAAEAFTAYPLSWNVHPGYLKDFADLHFARGVTHMVFHTYTHNPNVGGLPPGTSFGSGIGTPFLRGQTWWKDMPRFTDYLARCNYMLERGNPVADVLMYIGDEQNHKPAQNLTEFPEGYSYDYCNPDVLLNRLSVSNGCLVTPEGISYRILWLYDCQRMVPETLERLLALVRQGAVVAGNAPTGMATLGGGKAASERFAQLVKELWGDGTETVRNIGQGKVYNLSIADAVRAENILPDVNQDFAHLRWIHRKDGNADIYFLSAPDTAAFNGNVTFRAKGCPRQWNAVNGEISALAAQKAANGTAVGIHLAAGESCFVVFDGTKNADDAVVYAPAEEKELQTEWEIAFPEGWGVETQALTTTTLLPWKELLNTDEGRAFSGTATYKTSFSCETILPESRYILDLGNVAMTAEVRLNGTPVTTLWASPYSVDVTALLKSGVNSLEIDVTSTWHNRLVYDAGLPREQRKTWTISGPKANAELVDYGLMGPVKLRKMAKR